MTRRKLVTWKEFESLTEEELEIRLGAELGIPRPRNGTARQMILWWADVGMRLAEERYPKQRARPKGTTKGLPPYGDPKASKETRKQQRKRWRRRNPIAAKLIMTMARTLAMQKLGLSKEDLRKISRPKRRAR
jgi:hypothetical protein